MKSILFIFAALAVTPAFAGNLQLAGDCKPAVEKAIETLATGKVTVETVLEESPGLVVGYTRDINGRVVSGEAFVQLTNTKEAAITRNVYLIKCDVTDVRLAN